MKPYTKAAAATAAKWALGLSAGFILGPIVIGFASGTKLSGELIAEKLIVGIAWIPILFFSLWVWSALSKKDPVTGAAIETNKRTNETPVAIQKTGILEDSTHILKKQKKLVENNGSKKISNKEKNNQGKALFPVNCQLKQGIASNTQNMIAKGRTAQLQKGIPSEHTIENKVISKEKSILEELRDEGILTANEFIEKMAVVKAREEAERFEKLLCSIIEPFISKIAKLKNAGLLNEQEYEQKKGKIIEKHRAELLDEQERKQKQRSMIKERFFVDERAMDAQVFDYLDIIDKEKKLGLIKTQDEETNEIFRLQEIHQELVECNEICFQCYAFRKPSDEKCSACGQVFNEE